MNNQSLDRVNERILSFQAGTSYRKDLNGWLLTEDDFKSIALEIDSELQNLRQELVSEVEGLKMKPPYQEEDHRLARFDYESYLTRTERDVDDGHNEAIDKVLAIIKGEK